MGNVEGSLAQDTRDAVFEYLLVRGKGHSTSSARRVHT